MEFSMEITWALRKGVVNFVSRYSANEAVDSYFYNIPKAEHVKLYVIKVNLKINHKSTE